MTLHFMFLGLHLTMAYSQRVISVSIVSLLLGLMVFSPAQANAKTYRLTITVVDKNAEKNIGLFDDDGDQSKRHGLRKCSSSKLMWINENATRTSDIFKYQVIGNKTQAKIKNSASKVVGLGTLSSVNWVKDRVDISDLDSGPVVYGTCTYTTRIKIKHSDFYSIEITNTDISPIDISLRELQRLKWRLYLRA